MRIGELAHRAGITADTVRFYEKEGLVGPAKRLQNGYRAYAEHDLERLRFVLHCRKLDMTLEEVRELLALDASDKREAERVHKLLAHQLERVKERIRELSDLQTHLQALAARCSGQHEHAPCGILVGLAQDAHIGRCRCREEEK